MTVYEGRAVWCSGKESGWIRTSEVTGGEIEVVVVTKEGYTRQVAMTPDEAKILARQLNQLANRTIKRRDPTA